MKNYTFTLTFLLIVFFTNSVFSQKYGFVEQVKVLKAIKNYEKDLKSIDSLKNAYSNEIKKNQDKINEGTLKLLSSYKITEKELATITDQDIKAKLKPTDFEKFGLFKKEMELLNGTLKNYDSKLQTEYNNKIKPKLDNVNKVIEGYATKNKLDFIQIIDNSNSFAFVNPKLNITEEVVKLIN